MDEDKKEMITDGIKRVREWTGESMSVKIIFIIVMIIAMLVPEKMVLDIIHERMERSEEVKTKLNARQGGEQEFHGPVLSIPYEINDKKDWLHLYPENLKINANIDPEIRKLGIYETVLYQSTIDLSGSFALPGNTALKGVQLQAEYLNLNEAQLSFGVLDPSGIVKDVKVTVGDREITASPGIAIENAFSKGFHILLPIQQNSTDKISFATSLKIKGSKSLKFVPTGKQTEIRMKSTWKDPSFIGNFLTSSHEVTEKGFTAEWIIHDLQRDFKNIWFGGAPSDKHESVGVKLLKLNDVYQQILRMIKYAILFISFTFAALFISERLTYIKIHPLQYLLTGLASLLFYILLLSLSEHITFNTSYGITSSIITLLIAAYAKAIFSSIKMAWTLGAVSTLLYLFLFGTLQLEDYALLMGSFGLLFILAVVMFLTRGINQEQQLISD